MQRISLLWHFFSCCVTLCTLNRQYFALNLLTANIIYGTCSFYSFRASLIFQAVFHKAVSVDIDYMYMYMLSPHHALNLTKHYLFFSSCLIYVASIDFLLLLFSTSFAKCSQVRNVESKKYAMTRNWSNQNPNPVLKTKTENN